MVNGRALFACFVQSQVDVSEGTMIAHLRTRAGVLDQSTSVDAVPW